MYLWLSVDLQKKKTKKSFLEQILKKIEAITRYLNFNTCKKVTASSSRVDKENKRKIKHRIPPPHKYTCWNLKRRQRRLLLYECKQDYQPVACATPWPISAGDLTV